MQASNRAPLPSPLQPTSPRIIDKELENRTCPLTNISAHMKQLPSALCVYRFSILLVYLQGKTSIIQEVRCIIPRYSIYSTEQKARYYYKKTL